MFENIKKLGNSAINFHFRTSSHNIVFSKSTLHIKVFSHHFFSKSVIYFIITRIRTTLTTVILGLKDVNSRTKKYRPSARLLTRGTGDSTLFRSSHDTQTRVKSCSHGDPGNISYYVMFGTTVCLV